MESPFRVLALVASVLEEQGIHYVLVGSFASSIHGMYRSTADIDIVADVKPEQVIPLLNALQKSFYVDERAMREAVRRRQSFNAIHFDSVFKVDIFLPKSDMFSRQQIERRELHQISPEENQRIYVATAEDTILAKLRWYESGGQISSNQWSDVLGIIGAASERLDLEYLSQWAAQLGLTGLLDKALKEAGFEKKHE